MKSHVGLNQNPIEEGYKGEGGILNRPLLLHMNTRHTEMREKQHTGVTASETRDAKFSAVFRYII